MNVSRSKRGFTLVELLVVISVILIASSIIFVGGNGGAGASLTASTRIASGIAQGARGQAILKGVKTRLIIHNDIDASPDKYLRYFGIVYADPEELDQNNPKWIAATQGTYLPEGTYFHPALSRNNDWPDTSMRIEYPRNGPMGEGEGANAASYYYYEFNSNGTMANEFTNSWLVIGAGTLKGNPLKLEIDEEQESLVSALIFRRAGTTTTVNDPTSIN